MSKPPQPFRYYPALDGLRGLAIILVLVYHNFATLNFSHFGWLGVDLFFVLSGFLITSIILQDVGKEHWLRNFYVKRALRIFPLYFLALLLLLFLLPLLLTGNNEFAYYQQRKWWLISFLQNWVFIFDPPQSTGVLNHFWSLAVEEQFYLLWPFAILAIRKVPWLLATILSVLFFTVMIRIVVWNQQLSSFPYYSFYTFTRIDGICIGCAVALVRHWQPGLLSRMKAPIVFFFGVLNFGFFFVNRLHQFSFPFLGMVGYSTFAMLFGLLVYEAVQPERSWVHTIFDNAVFRFFGKYSFGIYVWHWPVYVLLETITNKWLSAFLPAPTTLLTSILLSAGAVLISLVSYHLWEHPFLKQKVRFG